MLGIKGIFLAVACLTNLYLINATVTTELDKLEFPDKELIVNDESAKNGKLVYASCTKNKDTKERDCQVVLEKFATPDDKKSCDIKMKLDNRKEGSDMDTDKMSIFPFGDNKAVIYLIDLEKDGFIQFNTVNFDGCKVTKYEMSLVDPSDDDDSMIITPYADSFDLFAYNHKAGQKHYLVSFDADGTKQDKPLGPSEAETYSSDVTRMIPVAESRDKGMFYMEKVQGDEHENELEFKLRKADGSDVSLGKQVVFEPMHFATNDDLISVCFKMNNDKPKFNCTQHDLNGEEKFNVNPLGDDEKSAVVGAHNLPGGGMLIAVGACDSPICSFYEVVFSVIKVDSTGATVGTAQIGKGNKVSESNDVEMAISFRTNEDNENCVSIVNYDSTATGRRNGGELAGGEYCLTEIDFRK